MRDRKASKSAEGVVGWLVDRAGDSRVDALLPQGWARAARDLLSGARDKRVKAPGALRQQWLTLYERGWVPGATVHLALRKRFVDHEVRRALAAGAEQLVVLGAGLDPLASRILADVPRAACFELDHPATQAVKGRALAADAARAAAVEPEDGCVDPGTPWRLPALIPVDLMRESVADALSGASAGYAPPAFRPEAPTVFVAEGLLMYLDAPRVETLFADIARIAAPGSRVVFTYAEGDEHGQPMLHRFGFWKHLQLKLGGERLMWCPSRDEVNGLLGRHGLHALETCATHHRRELLGDFLPRETPSPFEERFVVASVDGGC